MRFETANWQGTAMWSIRDSITKTDEYKQAVENIVTAVANTTQGKTVQEMMAIGGFTGVIKMATEVAISLDARLRVNGGSELIPMTAANVLRTMSMGDIRLAAQKRGAVDCEGRRLPGQAD